MADEILFEVTTLLGFTVRVTQSYWTLIVRIKHPVMPDASGTFKPL
jgi:hypothetical protein